MNLGREAATHFLTQLVVSLAGFIGTLAIALYLGAGGLGTYAVGLAIGYFWIQIPADALRSAIAKRVSEGEDQGAVLSAGLLSTSLIAIASAVFVLGLGWLLATISPSGGTEFERALVEFGPEVALLAVTAGLFKGAEGGLEGEKKVALSGVLKATERALRTTLQIAAMASGLGVEWLFLTHAGSAFLATAVGVLTLDTELRVPSRRHFDSLYSYARYSWLGTLEARTFGWMDTLVLSFIAPAGLIGIYEAAWGLASLLRVLSGSIQRTLFPEVSDLSASDATERVLHYLDEGLTFAGLLVIPGLVGSIVVGGRILQIYRPSFAQGEGILAVLVVASLFNVYSSQIINVINGMDRPDISYAVSLRVIAANLGMNVGLGLAYGWWGVAIATGGSAGLRLLLGYRGLRNMVGDITIPLLELRSQTLAAAFMGVFIAFLDANVPLNRAFTLLIVGFGAGVYFLVVSALSSRVRDKIRILGSVARSSG
jgi:O-antigen/teichoic acid export membrane protein